MQELLARLALLVLALLATVVVWFVGFLRVRFGWDSSIGQFVWISALPIYFAIWLGQVWIYWKVAAGSTSNDPLAVAILSGESVVSLAIVFYYGFKYGRGPREKR